MDVDSAKQKYRRNALLYNVVDRPTRRVREAAIARLELRPGQSALDFGCGTGLSLPVLERHIGAEGRIIGVDVSPDMLARARQRIASAGWTNVTLLEASADTVELPNDSVDGVLCFYTHDIMQSGTALQRGLDALRSGGSIVAAGVKEAHGALSVPLNALTRAYSRPAVTSLANFDRPWIRLEELLGPLEVEERLFGTAYIARGRKA